MPPCTRREECDDVPAPKSPLSTSATRNPRNAASRAMPAPVIPPPITSTSTGSAVMEDSAAERVCWENGVSAANSPPLTGGGRFRACNERGQSNAGWERTARRGDRRLPHAVLQGGDSAQGRARG